MSGSARILLRPARAAELPALSGLCLRSKAHWGYDAAFLAACREELTLTAEDLALSSVTVAEVSGRAVGVAQVAAVEEACDLCKLFVDPPAMGRGLGRALLAWVVAEARRMRARRLTIEADPGAVPFYEKMGARHVGEAPSGSIPGRRLPLLELEIQSEVA